MKYRVGDMANLLGISHEAVRFYEKQGLITPERDEKNGYRLYHAVDLNVLMRVRSYTSMGLTVSEAIALIKESDLFELSAMIKDKSSALAARIAEDGRLLMCLQLRHRHLRRVSGMLGTCTIENSPSLYGIVYRSNLDISGDITTRQRVRDWMQMRPYAEAMLIYNQENWTDPRAHTYRTGLCMDELFATALGVDRDPKVLAFPSVKSVYAIAEVPYEAEDGLAGARAKVFDHARDFIRAHHLTVTGDSYGRTLHTSMKSGQYVHYCEQWIPIK